MFLCLVLFFDAMGVGLILPVMPGLINELSDLPNSRAAEIAGYILFTYAAMQFVCAPVLGGLSDRFGRRPVLLLALLGFSADYFVMAVAPTLFWLFIARMISGVFGATFPAANACLVDISSAEQRARNFGFTGAAVGLGFVFGPAFGGLLGEYGPRLPFVVSGFLTLGVAIYGYFRFPETLAPEHRRPFDWKRANPFGSLLSISRFPVVIPILLAIFLVQFANQSYVSIWAFFTIEVVNWSPLAIGLSAGVYGITMVIVQGGLTGPVVKRYGEVYPALVSLLIGILTFFGLAFASSGSMIYFWIVVGGFTGFAFPAMQALMTKNVPEDSQGELQGAIASSFSLTAIVGPLLMTQLFGSFTRGDGVHFPGAPFVGGAVLIVLALCAFGYGTRSMRRRGATT